MPLNDIYVLPSNYPTFDWSEWPASKAALVQGGLTVNFQKEAWNDIVDQLAAALSAAGLGWDSAYTSIADAKITESPGSLTAAAFNSVRHNIDWPVPLGWKWANDPSFRGYLGRADFRGHSVFGASCDSVYSEYIIELVRKLNLLIGIMNGNKALPVSSISSSESSSMSLVELIPATGISLPVHGEGLSSSISAPTSVDVLRSAPMFPLERDMIIKSAYSADIRALRAVTSDTERTLLKTGYKANVYRRKAAVAQPVNEVSGSAYSISWDLTSAQYIASREISLSSAQGGVSQVPSAPIVGSGTAAASSKAAALTRESLPVSGAGKAEALSQAEFTPGIRGRVISKARSATNAEVNISALASAPVAGQENSMSLAWAALDSAWWPPEWQPDGGLWIRQSHAVTIAEDGGLEVT